MANPEHVELVKQGAEAIRQWREKNPDVRLDLTKADLRRADLHGADLSFAVLRDADLRDANLRGAILHGANLSDWADLRRTNLSGAILNGADLHRAIMHGANSQRANLQGVRGAEQAHGLETVRLIPPEDIQASGSSTDAVSFEDCHRPWPERWFDWERMRNVGGLPLFGISYTALILIPVVFYGLALYNDKVDLVRAWAEQVMALPDHPWHRLAPIVMERLHPRPIPNQSLLLLISTVLLAAGSTLYTFFSPSRIKEFSRDQWCDQLGRSLLHYWPLAWKHRYIRLACTTCYALGGLGAAWVLGTKVWHTAVFIWENSTWAWW